MHKRLNVTSLADRLSKASQSPEENHSVDDFINLESSHGILNLPLENIRTNPEQPRKHFDLTKLDELTNSVREHGILQPIIVRKDSDADTYLIIAGERRFRAAKAAGIPKIAALVRKPDNEREISLIENLQRQNLNPMEEAEGLLELKKAYDYTDDDVAKRIGKSRVAVSEILVLNKLPEDIKQECRTSDICTKSQLLSLVRAPDPDKTRELWEALKRGESTTVRAIRAQTKPSKNRRPRNFQLFYKTPSFRVTLTFLKTKVTKDELKEAAKKLLDHLSN